MRITNLLIKKIFKLSFLIFILIELILTSCEKQAGKKPEISIACSYSPVDVGCQIIKKSVENFQKMHPEIKVTAYWISKDYDTKLLTMISAGTSPDIFRVNPNWVPEFVSKGILLPLDNYVKKSKIFKLSDFFPVLIHKYRFDGKFIGKGPVYGFGTDWSPDFTMIYNKTMFKKEGIPLPENSYSWKEFLEVAKKLTKRNQNGQIIQFGCLYPDIELLVLQNNGKIYSEDGEKCLFDSKEAIEAIQFCIDLVNKYRVSPSNTELQNQDSGTMFRTGKIGMFFSGRYYTAILQSMIKDFEWGVAPCIHNKKRANIVAGPYGWVVSSKTKHHEEVWKLFEYFVVGDGVKELAKTGYNIPALQSIAYSDAFLSNPNHPKGMNKVFLDESRYAVPMALSPYVPRRYHDNVVTTEMDFGFLGKKTAEEVGKSIAKKINEKIREKLAAQNKNK